MKETKLGKFLPKRIAKFVGPTVMAASASVWGGAVCAEDEVPKSSDLQTRLEYSLTLPTAPDETWWFTAGPHYDEGSASRVKYAIDLTPLEIPKACPGSEPFMDKPVRAIADGVVSIVGNEKDPKDKNHSVVEVDHGDKFSSGYMHLDNILVDAGQKVEQGDPLGYVSCEFPPGGSTNGEHLHFYGELEGKPIEVDRLVMSGWTIEAAEENKQGTMFKDGEDIRTADSRRCGPQTFSIRRCAADESIRNDISWKDPQEEYIAPSAETAPTVALEPTVAPVPTIDVPVIPTVRLAEPMVEAIGRSYKDLNPYDPAQRQEWSDLVEARSAEMAWEFVNYLSSGTPEDLEAAYNMQVPEDLEFGRFKQTGRYGYRGSLELLTNCSLEMDAGQTSDINVNWPIPGGVPNKLTQEQYLNLQQGYDRDRFKILVTFTHNYTDAHGRRLGFKKFDIYDPYIEPYIVFEVVNNEVYIAEPRFCTYELSPLNN